MKASISFKIKVLCVLTKEDIIMPLQAIDLNSWWRSDWASPVAQMVKTLPAVWETQVQSLGWEDPLEKGMATDSSILAWRIPWTEEPGGLQSTGSQRLGHDWATNTFTFRFQATDLNSWPRSGQASIPVTSDFQMLYFLSHFPPHSTPSYKMHHTATIFLWNWKGRAWLEDFSSHKILLNGVCFHIRWRSEYKKFCSLVIQIPYVIWS